METARNNNRENSNFAASKSIENQNFDSNLDFASHKIEFEKVKRRKLKLVASGLKKERLKVKHKRIRFVENFFRVGFVTRKTLSTIFNLLLGNGLILRRHSIETVPEVVQSYHLSNQDDVYGVRNF